MPLITESRQRVEAFFKEKLELYKANLRLHRDSLLKPLKTEVAAYIEQEIQHATLWNEIMSAILAYADAVADESALRATIGHGEISKIHAAEMETHFTAKEKATIRLAEGMKRLISQCEIKFTDPTKPYNFVGEAATHALPGRAPGSNDLASSSASLYQILLGPLGVTYNDHNVLNVTYPEAQQDGPKYVLQEILCPKLPVPGEEPQLPNCSKMLWAAMSKVYADKVVDASRLAKQQGREQPVINIYLSESISYDSNFWLWELPAIVNSGVAVKYLKSSADHIQWEEVADFEKYKLTHTAGGGDQSIPVEKLRKIAGKFKQRAEDKDRERPLSVMVNVLKTKSVDSKGSKAYHAAGQAAERDLAAINNLEKRLEKLTSTIVKGNIYRERSIVAREEMLASFYVVGKKRKSMTLKSYNPEEFFYKKTPLDPKKIPTTLAGQLKLMQLAKQHYEYQLIINLFNKSQLSKKMKHSVQAKELLIWALNRRAEAALRDASGKEPKIKELAKKDLIFSKLINLSLEKAGKISKSALFEKARRLEILYSNQLQDEDGNVSIGDYLSIYSDNLKHHGDVASGAEYLTQVARHYDHSANAFPTPISIRDVRELAQNTYDMITLTGLDECVEPTLLRSAFLAAAILDDKEKIAAVKKRMEEVRIPEIVLNYMSGLHYCVLPTADSGAVRVYRLSQHPMFKEVLACQQRLRAPEKSKKSSPTLSPQERFWQSSYDYRQSLATYYGGVIRGGNLRFGGALPQQLVTNSDISIFTRMIDEPISKLIPTEALLEELLGRINAMSPPNLVAKRFFEDAKRFFYESDLNLDQKLADMTMAPQVLTFMRYIVAMNFQSIADSSDPSKAGYRQLDYAMNAMNLLMAGEARRGEYFDSRTSISIMYGIQIGDCRHHAESMQLLFDTWKRHRQKVALQTSDQEALEQLGDAQLRVVDTIEESTNVRGEKEFSYAHTFNVLQEVKRDALGIPDGYQHTVFDAFDLDQTPEEIEISIVKEKGKDELMFKTTKESKRLEAQRQPGKATELVRYKFAPYAGAKGDARANPEHLTLLGRSGITEESVFKTIVEPKNRRKMQNYIQAIATIEEKRERKAMKLDQLFEMMIVKGYDFNVQIPSFKIDEKVSKRIDILLQKRSKDLPAEMKDEVKRGERLLKFSFEIQRRADLYHQLVQATKLSKAAIKGSTHSNYKALWDNAKIDSNKDPIVQRALTLLNDYTKNDSTIVRLFTFHANRHHIASIVSIANKIKSNKICTTEQLMAELKKFTDKKGFNSEGSLARVINFIEERAREIEGPLDTIKDTPLADGPRV